MYFSSLDVSHTLIVETFLYFVMKCSVVDTWLPDYVLLLTALYPTIYSDYCNGLSSVRMGCGDRNASSSLKKIILSCFLFTFLSLHFFGNSWWSDSCWIAEGKLSRMICLIISISTCVVFDPPILFWSKASKSTDSQHFWSPKNCFPSQTFFMENQVIMLTSWVI